MSWSTGKDSAYALHLLRKSPCYEVVGLFTTVTQDYRRVSMHATSEQLLAEQAKMLNLRLHVLHIPANCDDDTYRAGMKSLIHQAQALGIEAMGFGDLFLRDVRVYREQLLAGTGIEPVFPIWNISTNQLALDIINSGTKAVICCVDPRKLDKSFAGKFFDAETICHFPKNVDPCGEQGEFHTFVFAAPDFTMPIDIMVGKIIERDGFAFADIMLNDEFAFL